MGGSQSLLREQRCVRGHRQHCDKPGAQVQRRIQLLEELCSHGFPGMRAAALEQLAGGQAGSETMEIANVLVSIPPEFSPGELIAAGSYGRVYAGTYAGQPAALKLLLLDEDTAHAILNEVRLCLRLSHKNLVQLLHCAVVATNKEAAAAGFPAPASPMPALTGQHQILPLFGSSSSMPAASAECPFSYLPVVSGRAPVSSSTSAVGHQAMVAAAGKDASSMAAAEVSPADSGRLPVLSSSLGHACFEVWIAMELCDGGTLAEQLQRGFHCHADSEEIDMEQLLQVGLDIARALTYMHLESVCHGDLKTENVLLKTLSPASQADMQRACSSCGSSSCQDDCNWLTFVCNNSTCTSNTCTSRCCRSCSGDSCWSCGTRVGCLDNGSSSPDSCSTSSSSASGPNAERRSSRSFKGSHILSGLCCMGSPSSCATEDDMWDEEERVASGCFACGGCGVMTLEPNERSRFAPSVDTVQQQQKEQQQQAEVQQQRMDQQTQLAPYGPAQFDGDGPLQRPSRFAASEVGASSSSSMAAAVHYGGFNPWSQGLPAAIVEGLEQPMQLPLLPPPGLYDVPEQSDPSYSAVEDGPEEEHVAPLSLYAHARQRRRSRCLPHGVVLPAALAAAAAAAAAAMNASDAPLGSAGSSGGGSTSSGSEDEGGQPKKQPHARASMPLPQPLQRQGSLDDSCLPSATAGLWDASLGPVVAGSSASSSAHHADSRPSWQDPAALSRLGSLGAAPACEVYAHSMMRPPVARRARRHSYCYGSAASYGASVFSYGKLGPGAGQPAAGAGISASDAAAAIAAAADAIRQDSARAAGAAPRGSRRNRRMSWDDRMMRQQSPTRSGLSGLLGAALPGLAHLSTDGLAQGTGSLWGMQQQPRAPASSRQGGGRRTRRHSWAGYLQPDMSGAAAALGWGMHSCLAADRHAQQQEQLQQQLASKLPPSAYGSLYGASMASVAGSSALGPIPSSSGQARRARRHSWAGYAGYGLEQAPNKLSGFRALSSWFVPDGPSHSGSGGLQTSPSRHMFSLPQFPGCCGEGFMRPLDDPGDSRHALLDGVASSSILEDGSMADCLLLSGADAEGVASVGCFGRWCTGSGTSSSFASSFGSGSQQKGRRRRYSWCCGAGSEAELWADLTREDSCSQTGLLSGAAPMSVPLLPAQPRQQRKQRRDRRCSWDDFRYRSKLSQNWGRKASSLDAQISTPDSWRSQHFSVGSRSPDTLSRQSQLYRSSSDAAGAQLAAAAAAATVTPRLGSQSEGLPRVVPLSEGSSAAGSVAFQQQEQPQPGSDIMQLISMPPSCSSSPAVDKPCTTPVAPIKAAAPRSPVAADTRTDVQVDQSLSGLNNVCMALPLPVAKTSRVRVSLDQPPLPLSPTVQQQALQQPLYGAAEGAQAPPMAWVDAASAAAVPAAAVRQVTVQDLLSLCAPAPLPAPAAAAAVAAPAAPAGAPAAAGTPAGPGMALVGPLDDATAADLFIGSFTLHPSSSRVGLDSSAAADSSATGAAGKGRGRRWSTGVAAHQLLLRKQLLDEHGRGVLGKTGLQPGRSSSPSAAAAADVSTHAGAAPEQPASLGTWHVPVGEAVMAPRLPRSSSSSRRSSTSSSARRASGLESSTGVSAAINVLGMPRQWPAVMSQRRMSYDTATGAYQVVVQMDEKQLSEALSPSQQLLQEQQPLLPQAAGQAPVPQRRQASPLPVEVCDLLPGRSSGSRTAGSSGQGTQSAAGSRGAAASPQKPFVDSPQKSQAWQDEQMQQQCQAQMQRLLEALARKGYGGMQDADGAPTGSSSNAGAQGSPQQALAPRIYDPCRAVASLEHQQEVAHNATHVPQRRFCAKVCDFGFSKCLRAGQSHCSTASAGTITHQAPEVLRSGHLSPAADVYAFGIILWELLTRDRPFRGLLEGDLVVGVCDQGLRPVFPPGCPASYVALAQQCWSDDPAVRPTAAQLVKRLNELLYEERRARLRASVGVNGVHHSSNQHASCRRRRHSMPIAGYSRQRRRSRRMSLFLLPFTRQPVVPEDAPLDQQLEDLPCTTSGQCAVHSAAGPGSQGRSSSEQQSICGSPHRMRGSSLPQTSGVNSSGCHVCLSGGSSAGIAAASESAGGLPSSGGALARLKGVLTAAAPAGSTPVSAVHAGSEAGPASARAVQSGPAAAGGVSADGTEWFESF